MTEKKWTILRSLLGIGLLGAVALTVDWAGFVEVFSEARPLWLLLVLGVHVGDRIYMAAKWRYLLAGLRVKISYAEAVVHYFVGGLVGTALQWHLGGDLARAAQVGSRKDATALVSSSVVLEKLAGFSALGMLAVFSALLLNTFHVYARWALLIPAGAACLGAFAVLGWSPLSEVLLSRIGSFASALAVGRWKEKVAELSFPVARVRLFRRRYLLFFGLTLLEQFVAILGFFLLTRAFSVPLSVPHILAFFPIVEFLSRLPVSPQALGIREGLFVFLLGIFGIGTGTAFALAIAGRLVSLAVLLVGATASVLSPTWRGRER